MIENFASRFLVRFWPFTEFSMTNIFLASPKYIHEKLPKVSVIITARNEAGNIHAIFERVPQMCDETELIL